MTSFTKTTVGVAADDHDVEKRINEFLWGGVNSFGSALDSLMDGPFSRFSRSAIVGGMVRDIARGDAFNSDIDIVIDATTEEVEEVALPLKARRNVFGGWTMRRCGTDIDFWALESTWALRTGVMEGRSLDVFPKTTFFTHDAAYFDLNSRRVVSDGVFWDSIKLGGIEINLEPTPSITGNLYRAVNRVLKWGLVVGPRLSRFIDQHLDDDTLRKLRELELRKGHPVLVANFGSSKELKAAVLIRSLA